MQERGRVPREKGHFQEHRDAAAFCPKWSSGRRLDPDSSFKRCCHLCIAQFLCPPRRNEAAVHLPPCDFTLYDTAIWVHSERFKQTKMQI